MNKAPDRPQPPALRPVEDEAAADLSYIVETSPAADPEALTVLARLHSLAVAEATWQAAADERRGARVVLRQGARILRRGGPA
ncbi:hypothetical protein [Phenylobacterium sp.]|uniref:hypothetical protein n=1 Tax=Phenylobacterium sp. TaxID=1871053 RepID=UPI002C3F57B9|nr:hypothetical protein [Phenylobacterium sp.]HVI34415.1 hypothetical protein [Phenylobacterium sp.]